MNLRREEDLYVETCYEIVYEDDFFMAVNKPAPLPVHPVGRFKEKSLLSLLKKDRDAAGSELRIVNRLDSETSGLVIVAKSSEAAGKFGLLFEKRCVEKEYQAVVLGHPAALKGSIRISLGTETRNFQHVRVSDPEGQDAWTDYEVLKESGGYALLKIIPHTGRTHQIRAHMALMGHPIAGDKIYIDSSIFERYVREGWQEDMRPVVKAGRLLLHAVKLAFEHPMTGRRMEFFSEVPEVFKIQEGLF